MLQPTKSGSIRLSPEPVADAHDLLDRRFRTIGRNYQTATAQQFALSPIAERRSWRSALRVTEIPQLRRAALGTFAAEGVESQPNHYNCKQPLVFRPEPPDGMQQHLSGSGRIISRPDTSTLEGPRIFKYLRWCFVCFMDRVLLCEIGQAVCDPLVFPEP